MKTLFKIGLDHQIDLITNSSSELFVLNAENYKTVVEMITEQHPDWETEYENPIQLKDFTSYQIETYLSYNKPYNKKKLPTGITIDQILEKQDNGSYARRGYICYNWDWINNNFELLKQAMIQDLDPEQKLWFLFSINENPNWEMQENLMNIGTRYHLG